MVSIIMPVYNTNPQWLERAINSCLNQSYQDFELIIIDNETTNTDTLKCLIQYKKNNKVKFFYCPKQKGKRGVSLALNVGIKKSKGTYIARMDSDDEMITTRLEKQVNYLQDNPHVYVLGSQMWIEAQGIFTSHPQIINRQNVLNYNPSWFLNHPSVMFRRELFEEIGLYEETPEIFPEDLELWTRCIVKGIEIRNLEESLLNYNFHLDNVSKKDSVNKEWNDNINKYIQRLK